MLTWFVKCERAIGMSRPRYRTLTKKEKESVAALQAKARELKKLINKAPNSQYTIHARMDLDRAMMWAVKCFTEWDGRIK